MDRIDPRTHTIHEPIEGENLRKERLAADKPFPAAPWDIGKALAVVCIIGLFWFVACAFQMEMPV